MPTRSSAIVPLLAAALLLAGCAGTEETGKLAGTSPEQRASAPAPELASAGGEVRTVQLYRGDDERTLPVITLGGDGELTLEFDLMSAQGHPLSVYFYHADRTWQRDLVPSQYLTSFSSDHLLDYTASQGTQVPYTHYRYRFPNKSIGFEVSGNYILRVTEQGREGDVLFERAFFVTEQAGPLEFGIKSRRVQGREPPVEVPVARFTPPPSLAAGTFDFTACFMPNGRLGAMRCDRRPLLVGSAALTFRLTARAAFETPPASYLLDLTTLQESAEIASVDRSQTPPRVALAPDYVRFGGTRRAARLAGQAIIEAPQSVAAPDVAAEYVRVHFRLVPPAERPFPGPVFVTGSFDGPAGRGHRLTWQSGRGHYEGTVLVKQGRYAYRYTSPDPDVRAILQQTLPYGNIHYAAFVYYADYSLGTDRLLVVRMQPVR